jgi:hypothetical protein
MATTRPRRHAAAQRIDHDRGNQAVVESSHPVARRSFWDDR